MVILTARGNSRLVENAVIAVLIQRHLAFRYSKVCKIVRTIVQMNAFFSILTTLC